MGREIPGELASATEKDVGAHGDPQLQEQLMQRKGITMGSLHLNVCQVFFEVFPRDREEGGFPLPSFLFQEDAFHLSEDLLS